jgi:hypothetical protein
MVKFLFNQTNYLNKMNLTDLRKLIRHTWNKHFGTGKLKHATCPRCLCEKYFSPSFGQLIYVDRFGKTHYKTPSCVLPNTKL